MSGDGYFSVEIAESSGEWGLSIPGGQTAAMATAPLPPLYPIQ